MIRLSQVTLIRGTKTLLVDAGVTLNPGDKLGLIGPNGSGKSCDGKGVRLECLAIREA